MVKMIRRLQSSPLDSHNCAAGELENLPLAPILKLTLSKSFVSITAYFIPGKRADITPILLLKSNKSLNYNRSW